MRNALSILLLLVPIVVSAQHDADSACRERIRQAFGQHHALPDSGSVVRRVIRMTRVGTRGGVLDSMVTTIETLTWIGGRMVRSEGTEVWSDDRTVILANPGVKRLQVVDLDNRRAIAAAQKHIGAMFPDSVTAHGREFRCEEFDSAGARFTRARFRIDSTMQEFLKAAAIDAVIDGNGEIVRLAVAAPRWSATRNTEFVVEELDRDHREPGIPGPVIDRFFDETGALRPEFTEYRK